MRVLIVKNAPFHRTGGATVTDRAIGPQLVAAGHACVWVGTLCVWSPSGEVDTEAQERAQLRALDIEAIEGTWPIRFEERGMEVHLVRSTVDLPAYLEALSAAEPFDWIVLNGHLVPETMGRLLEVFPPERTVISCMACMGLLFGRNREYDRPDVLDMFRRVRDVFCPSEHVRRYLAESEVKATTLYLPVFGPGPFPKLGDPEGFILMVNPAQMKGIDVFLRLAEALPHRRFAAVRSWGFEPSVAARMKALPNVQVLDPVQVGEMDRYYRLASILLVPTVVEEAFGLVVVEGMLRGLPVLASQLGGIPEAKLGVPYILPVTPVDMNAPREAGAPPTYPAQDVGPWKEVVERLLSDPVAYEELSERSRRVATEWVAGLSPRVFPDYLEGLRCL